MINRPTSFETSTHGLLVLALATAVVACSTGDSPLQPTEPLPAVTVARIAEVSPDRMWVTISNYGLGHFSYGGCAVRVTRQVGDAWEPMPEGDPVFCAAIAYSFPAGAVHSFNVARPTADGRYRAEVVVRHSNSERDFRVVSEPFIVGPVLADVRAPSR